MFVHGYGEEDETFALKSVDGRRTFLEMPMQLLEITGLAMPPLSHRTVRSPYQHGESYLGFSLRPRIVQIALHMRGCSRFNMWQMRQELISLINPLIGTLRMRVSFRDGGMYELHQVVYDAGFEVGTDNQPEPSVQRLGARFIAYDPVWWKHPEHTASPSLTIAQDLIFGDVAPPASVIFPITFGAVHILESLTLTTTGSWLTYPTIILTGPMQDPRVENLSTDEKLEMDYSIANGEIVTITTEFGRKTVTNNDGDNLIGYLTPGSDLATFHLDPDPIVDGGVNILSFRAYACTAGSDISFTWFDRYLGI